MNLGKNKGKRALEEVKPKAKIKNKSKNKKRIWPKVLLILLVIILITGGVFAYNTYKNGGGISGMLATAMGHSQETKKNLPEFKVLLLGVSTDLDSTLTDTIMVASYNPNIQKATILSIPRDTFIGKNKTKATGSDKINAIYSIKGPEGTLAEVNRITKLDIKYYIVVETEALIKLVDAIGGVQFNVPIDMKYDDKTQDLHINIQAGEQIIDGVKAEHLLRFRHNNNGTSYPVEYGDNDIGRMRTQREFIAEVMRQTLKADKVFKIGEILDIAKQYVKTNVDFNVLKDYVPYLVEFSTENLTADSLPGKPEICNQLWFFLHDKKETQKLIITLYNNGEEKEEENTANNMTNNTTNNTTSNTTKETAKIEVVNGTSDEAIMDNVVEKLKTAGFNVTIKKGKTNKTSRTVIINQKYIDNNILEEIKQTLGKGDISNSASSTSKYDISIVIGSDYI